MQRITVLSFFLFASLAVAFGFQSQQGLGPGHLIEAQRTEANWPCSEAAHQATNQPFNYKICQVGFPPYSRTYAQAEIEFTMFRDTPQLKSIEIKDETRNLNFLVGGFADSGAARTQDEKTKFKLTELFGPESATNHSELRFSVNATSLDGLTSSIKDLIIKLKKQ